MLGTDKYAIDNKKLLGRLMPFFMRGRNLFSVLLAAIFPIESVHSAWREWALARIIESVATSQPVVLKWYLKKMLLPYMEDSNDEFRISPAEADFYIYIFEDESEQTQRNYLSSYWAFQDDDDEEHMLSLNVEGVDVAHLMEVRDLGEYGSSDVSAMLTVSAPKHISSISDADYIRFIKQCVEKYLVYDMEYGVSLSGTSVNAKIEKQQQSVRAII